MSSGSASTLYYTNEKKTFSAYYYFIHMFQMVKNVNIIYKNLR
jgi:hypothetical protein